MFFDVPINDVLRSRVAFKSPIWDVLGGPAVAYGQQGHSTKNEQVNKTCDNILYTPSLYPKRMIAAVFLWEGGWFTDFFARDGQHCVF